MSMINEKGVIHIQSRQTKGNWAPIQGESFTQFLDSMTSLAEKEKEEFLVETMSILSRCINPKNSVSSNTTGLVMGYVQSGKTMSFTGLSALARDNDYQIILLLGGTTNNLVEQSFERLKNDLGISGQRKWKVFTTQNQGFGNTETERLESELTKWENKSRSRAKTILLVAMKNHTHLAKLNNYLNQVNLAKVPTLIIDDEGDQAGLNTKVKQNDFSTTHEQISKLRNLFPCHSYLCYTATPQAPLLISRIDTLSPDFGIVLTPGENYIGGQEIFGEGNKQLIKMIPKKDIPEIKEPPIRPPKSLLDALKDFFIGVAIGLKQGDDASGNRTMMIHPATSKDLHKLYYKWVKKYCNHWKIILNDPESPGHNELFEEFRDPFYRIVSTYPVNFSFDEIKNDLIDAVSETIVQEINTRENSKIPIIDWGGDYSWILVGGIGLDRGFTIEGLTVSYMLRSIGIGNADSIQQRGRFFGYKKQYLGLCRIYLTSDNISAFEDYVHHEESVRNSIRQNLNCGKSLKDWCRSWYLESPYKPTRQSVIDIDMYYTLGRGGWFVPNFPYENHNYVVNNRETVDRIINKFDFNTYRENGWNQNQEIPFFSDKLLLKEIIPYIGEFSYQNPQDSLQHRSILHNMLYWATQDSEFHCSFYGFSRPWNGIKSVRSLDTKDPPRIKALFQGRDSKTNYPGARKIHSESNFTFQLHRYHLLYSKSKKIAYNDVPILAVFIPDNLVKKIWIEKQ